VLYLIGGPGRSGKTTLARRLTLHHRIPHFGLDYLMMGLSRGAPGLGIDPMAPEAEVAGRLWSVCEALIDTMVAEREEFALEGFAISPARVEVLGARHGAAIRPCFLGQPGIDPDARWHLEQQTAVMGSWMLDLGQGAAIEEFGRLREASRHLEQECDRLGLEFFDTSDALEEPLRQAEAWLTGGA
jgi:hypothetical protein